MLMTMVVGILLGQAAATGPIWTFDGETALRAWTPNGDLKNVAIRDGVLHADAKGGDPSFHCRDLSIPATPWQYVLVRIKANKSGTGELFWSGSMEGKYGGLSEEKKTQFKIPGDGQWHEIPIFPFWQADKTIRQMRFDVYDDASFDIAWLKVVEWGTTSDAKTDVFSWTFNGDPGAWRVCPGAAELFSPPLNLAVGKKGWVTIRLRSEKDSVGTFLWSAGDILGMKSEDFTIRGGAGTHAYNVELQGLSTWHDGIVAVGLRFPKDSADVRLESLTIAEGPSGPSDLVVNYFGFENGVNRVGRPSRLLAVVQNYGGAESPALEARLTLPEGVSVVESGQTLQCKPLPYGEQANLLWTVVAQKTGAYAVDLSFGGKESPQAQKTTLRFTAAPDIPKADYVPAPRPVATDVDVSMLYFPGWDSDAKWECIRRIAPVRKPVLGYYDESKTECVDWQIKWAVENGISCFLVDWYWTNGNQMLTHWFDAYRKARYRDTLKVAIMWANHNPPDTHSAADWRTVTQYWIDHYFNLPSYYRIDGKPAIFLWDPDNLHNDLKGTEAVRAALDESQTMARAAGYTGITFVAMHRHDSTSQIAARLEEGYVGATAYHEWGKAPDLSSNPKRLRYEDVVATSRATWEANDATHGKLTYYPLVETGWDSRPWHGNNAMVIEGRTPALFERLLRDAKDYCAKTGKRLVVLGPANEWGEGSYIEPCTEYDFDMYERIRAVFGKGDPATWPVNTAPSDVGLGPYDFPPRPLITSWDFGKGPQGWSVMMGIGGLECRDGALHMRATSTDPALMVELPNLLAADHPTMKIRMTITGTIPSGTGGQLFWSQGGSAITEATTVRFGLETDGKPHTYTLDLKASPRWRGRISSLRFDPCETKDVAVTIEHVELCK